MIKASILWTLLFMLLNPGWAQRYAYIMNALLFKINTLHSILAMAAKEKK